MIRKILMVAAYLVICGSPLFSQFVEGFNGACTTSCTSFSFTQSTVQYDVTITGTGASMIDEGFNDVLADGSSSFTVTIKRNDGGLFTFNSILVRNTTKADANVTVGGYKSNALVGSLVTIAPNFCGTATPASCASLNFSSIVVDEVRIASNNNDFSFDNFGANNTAVDPAPSSATVAATVFLEGAFNGTNLNTSLNASIPTTQPYSINGHSGGSAGSIPANAVDWVLVELREAGSAGAALNSTRKGSAAGFLMNDGTIKATDGTSDLTVNLTGNSGADFYIVIYHRNHLPIMSASAVSESSGTYTIDFTSNSANTHQTTTALVTLSGGKFGMPSGDADGDGDVDGSDLTSWRSQNGNSFTYNSTNADFNLDGVINAVDRNLFWKGNNSASKTRQVPST